MKKRLKKQKMIQVFNIIRAAELTCEMIGGKNPTDSRPFADRINKLDARRKDFEYSVAQILAEFNDHVKSKIPQQTVKK